MADWNSLTEVHEKLLALIEEMLGYEQEKRQALLRDDTVRIEQMLQRQQACAMQMETLERQRMMLQDAAGIPGTAEELLAGMAEGPEKEKLAGVMGKLWAAAEELRELNKGDLEIARTFLQINGGIMPEAAPSRGLDTYQAAKRFGADGGFEQKI